ncbi:MAG: phenylalanine--tRNA ligase subunit beta, partial [Pseudomonadota bacterium]
IGLRPINARVDITNYISYDRARPLHVYDVSKLTGAIHIRHGRQGEKFLALDGKEYAVDESMCVIADEKSVLGLGGVMGGEASGCTEDTTDVFVECALFDALTTARTGRKTGIVSDARYRFERGVDPQTVETGMALATQLILDLCGGTASEVTIAGTIPPWKKTVDFPPAEVLRLTGMDIPDSQKEDILESLGFDVKRGGVWSVKVPSFRPDIAGKADLVEEIARIHSLHHLPTEQLPPLEVSQKPKPSMAAIRQRLSRETLFHAGYHEAITWAFCDEKAATLFGGATELTLANPISADLSMMRPSALPNLLLSVANNVARGADKVRLFEIGGGYTEDTPQGQSTVLSAVSFGTEPKAWNEDAAQPDIYALK